MTKGNPISLRFSRHSSKPKWSFSLSWKNISRMWQKLSTKPMTASNKITLQNEEILLSLLNAILTIHKDGLAIQVELSKINGDMAVSMRDMSDALQEIAFKLPNITGDDLN